MERLAALLGIVVILGAAALMSSDRRRIPWRLVGAGVALQAVLGALLLVVPGTSDALGYAAAFVVGLLRRADEGIAFVFSRPLLDPSEAWGSIFAVRILPVIIFFSALMAVLYHVGVMQRVIGALAWLLRRSLGVTGAEALAMAANVFVGQTEAPLTVKPLLERMTRAQLMTLMVGGFATVAGSVLATYVLFLGGQGEEQKILFTRHLLTASLLSAPAAFVLARIMVPETESPPDDADVGSFGGEAPATNILDAAAGGATAGLRLALNVGAMLIAFLGLLALVNWPLEALGSWGPIAGWLEARGVETLRLETILGWALAPAAWLIGVGWADAPAVGSLMGQKIFVTEFIAFKNLGAALAPPDGSDPVISARAGQIAAYALCGFANFGSIAIQIGGLSSLAPSRRADFSRLAVRAMIGGAMASAMTAAVAGLFIGGVTGAGAGPAVSVAAGTAWRRGVAGAC